MLHRWLRGRLRERVRRDSLVTAGSQTKMATYRISPTDLVYLWNQCRFCFTDVVKNGLQLPRSFSPHFTSADRAVRTALADLEIVDCGVGPRFRIIAQGLWVESQPIPFPEHGLSLSFFGQLDALVVTEHDEVFVVDYKTTTLDDTALSKFRRQLSCYVTAIERPKAASHSLPKYVDGMALLIFDPATFALNPKTKNCGLYGRTRWLELPRRDDLFDAFLTTVAATLAAPEPPQSLASCGICRLRFNRDGVPSVGSRET